MLLAINIYNLEKNFKVFLLFHAFLIVVKLNLYWVGSQHLIAKVVVFKKIPKP